jgi:hypothetical protein
MQGAKKLRTVGFERINRIYIEEFGDSAPREKLFSRTEQNFSSGVNNVLRCATLQHQVTTHLISPKLSP